LIVFGWSADGHAATPKAAALPDWSGVWGVERKPENNFNFDPDTPRGVPVPAPLTPEYQKLYDDARAAEKAGKPGPASSGSCRPLGMPRSMTSFLPREFVVTPRVVYVLNEAKREVRRIFTDGRPHPEEPEPTFSGHSIGHWEGRVLTVDTIAVKAGFFDPWGLPHSDAIHIKEQIRQINPQTLEVTFDITDPKALTRPWKIVRRYNLKPDWAIQESYCEENNREVRDAQGNYVGTILPATPPK
jgi:hypothetical protein